MVDPLTVFHQQWFESFDERTDQFRASDFGQKHETGRGNYWIGRIIVERGSASDGPVPDRPVLFGELEEKVLILHGAQVDGSQPFSFGSRDGNRKPTLRGSTVHLPNSDSVAGWKDNDSNSAVFLRRSRIARMGVIPAKQSSPIPEFLFGGRMGQVAD